MKNLFTCLVVCVLSGTIFADVWTVDDDGKADFDNIQAAVDAASDGDEIIVMPGTYTSTQDGHVVNMLGKAVTLRSSDPTDSAVVEATIIDGENARRGLACFNGETSSTVINGFTITNGLGVDFDYNGDGDYDYWEPRGGGMYNESDPTVSNCVFKNNTAHRVGGMYNRYCDPTITDCDFTNNGDTDLTDSTGGYGGAMQNDHANPTLTNCTFTDNYSVRTGGMHNTSSSPSLSNCTFTNNSSSVFSSGAMVNYNSTTTLTNCTFTNNTSNTYGGGLHNYVLNDTYTTNITLTNCTISGNTANTSGSGMYNMESSSVNVTLVDTIVCGNTTDQIEGTWTDGGGVCVSENCDDCSYCPAGQIEDCNGNCCPEGWATDQYCDDGSYTYEQPDGTYVAIYLNCDEFNCDGGACDCTAACPADWCVDDDGTADFDNIQDAIDAASDGDEILVYPGTYTSTGSAVVDMKGKTVWLHSSDGAETTIINGEWTRRGVLCNSLETLDTIIEGFTIQYGYASTLGGGAFISGSNPTFIDCDFTYNNAVVGGGVGVLDNGIGTFENCLFDNNSVSSTGYYAGGGAYYQSSFGQNALGEEVYSSFTDCIFTNNHASDSSGGAIYLYFSSATFDGCSMSGNLASSANGISGYAANYEFVGLNTIEDIFFADSVTLSFAYDDDGNNSCSLNGDWAMYTHFCLVNTQFDVDALNSDQILTISGAMTRGGSLSVSNESNTLADAIIGDVIPLIQTTSLSGGIYDSMVFPEMPDGLGLQLVENPALQGSGTEIAIEVVASNETEFDDPNSTYIWYEPIDLIEFDADGDGKDEIAALFDGSPGYVKVYLISEDPDTAPTEIASFDTDLDNNPIGFDAGDLNGDGKEDLIAVNFDGQSINVLLTTLDGEGKLSFNKTTIASGAPLTCVSVIDWDGDEYLDIVIGGDFLDNSQQEDAYQVIYDVGAVLKPGPIFYLPTIELPDGSEIGDTPTCVHGGNRSGAWGFVGGTKLGRAYRLKPGDIEIGYGNLLAENMGYLLEIESKNLDDKDDGLIDLYAVSNEAESLYLFEGETETEFDPYGFSIVITLNISVDAEDILSIDADRDGDMDFIIASSTSDPPLRLLRNDGASNGLFASGLAGRSWSSHGMNSTNTPSHVAKGDLDDRDEDDDWILATGDPPNARDNCIMEQTNLLDIASCPADLNGDDVVSVTDLLQLISAWGSCESCPEDLDGDGEVAVSDLLEVIAEWGPCE